MSQEPRSRRIEIPDEVVRAEGVPEDLQSEIFHTYSIPNVLRRRRSSVVCVIVATITALGISRGLPKGMWLFVGLLVILGVYHWIAAWDLHVREGLALEVANRATDFPVGHASAVVSFIGWRARPVWNVLLFSSEDPPTRRGLVRVDGLSAEVIDSYVECVPSM